VDHSIRNDSIGQPGAAAGAARPALARGAIMKRLSVWPLIVILLMAFAGVGCNSESGTHKGGAEVAPVPRDSAKGGNQNIMKGQSDESR
jgi:hypothetical protein